MRIAVFSSTIDVTNGYGNITYEYCRELQKKGVDFTLFLPRQERKTVDASHVTFPIEFVLPPYIFRIKIHNILPYLFPIRLRGFDLVHSLFDFPYCVLAAYSAKKSNLPFIMGAQGTYGVLPLTYWPEKYLLRWAYRQAKEIIVPSQFTKEKIEEFARQRYNIRVIHNGVNFSRFSSAGRHVGDIKEKHYDRKILLTVGGLKRRKGQELVIQALPIIRKEFPDVVYIMVGDGSMKGALQTLANQCGVRDLVEFAGVKRGNELLDYFHACDIYIHTPQVVHLNFEGFGIVYLEAGACKKPVIATNAGGVNDAVKNDVSGFVVADGDIAAIAHAVKRILREPALAEQLGREGYRYAREHDWAVILDQFIALYKIYAT